MTNYDRALAALEAARRPGDLRIHPHDAVEALAQAGLLAEDLPQPTNTLTDESLVWELTTDWDMHVTLREGKIFLGDKQLHPLVVKELSLNLMAALYATADYEDEEA